MDIFENLEELNVSEECFNDIMDIVEELLNETVLNQIKKVYGNTDKANDLLGKAYSANREEFDDRIRRNKNQDPLNQKSKKLGGYNRATFYANRENEKNNTKNSVGQEKNVRHQFSKTYSAGVMKDSSNKVIPSRISYNARRTEAWMKKYNKNEPYGWVGRNQEADGFIKKDRVQSSIARNKAKQEKKNK